MRSSFSDLLGSRDWLLGDGATGTNYFAMGLKSGEPPENWNIGAPDKVRALHRQFIEAGSDIVLTNTFGGNRLRLELHGAQDRAAEINRAAALLAGAEAEAAKRSVLVAGSMGPTGGLIQPLGDLVREDVVSAFSEQAGALAEGGADLLWIETISSEEEASAAVEAASATGLPIVLTMSFDTGGRTMMGIKPKDLPGVVSRLPAPVAAYGANCGVGAAELVATILGVCADAPDAVVVAKGNCGVPELIDGEIRYSGSPELMADYACLALDAGARIIGGCCGTTPDHVRAMHRALNAHKKGPPPHIEDVEARLGTVSRLAHGVDAAAAAKERRAKAAERRE